MGTKLRPEISDKHKYWIDKHRYYELKHFCMQYPIWKRLCSSIDGFSRNPSDLIIVSPTNTHSDPTADCALSKEHILKKIRMIECVAIETDRILSKYILIGVTEAISYTQLKARLNIPCCRDTYYELYRRFFWLLSNVRN